MSAKMKCGIEDISVINSLDPRKLSHRRYFTL
jgi:hypothetical protein